jgi:DNA ligase-1
MDAQLFAWSYDYVGDLAETVALVWPEKPGANREPDLSEVVESLRTASRTEVQRLIEGWLDALDADGRWALLKLMTGGLRVGVSARLAKQACADFGQVEIGQVEEVWHAMAPPYGDLFAWLEGARSSPRPTRRGASGR